MANAPEKNPAEAQRDLAAAMSTLASRPAPTGKRPLTGRERAAVLMLALGEQYSAKIWGMLDDDELRELSGRHVGHRRDRSRRRRKSPA